MALTDSQRTSWTRTRAKGQRRVLVEQFLVGATILAGGQSLRALLMACVFGVLAWNRMERLYAEATRAPAAPAADKTSRR